MCLFVRDVKYSSAEVSFITFEWLECLLWRFNVEKWVLWRKASWQSNEKQLWAQQTHRSYFISQSKEVLHQIFFIFVCVQVKNRNSMANPRPAPPDAFTPSSDSVYSDQFGFYSLDCNVPGLSQVILDKLKMKDYKDYRWEIHSDVFLRGFLDGLISRVSCLSEPLWRVKAKWGSTLIKKCFRTWRTRLNSAPAAPNSRPTCQIPERWNAASSENTTHVHTHRCICMSAVSWALCPWHVFKVVATATRWKDELFKSFDITTICQWMLMNTIYKMCTHTHTHTEF